MTFIPSRPLVSVLALPLAVSSVALFAPLSARADTTLPNPYVSRALDAVLLPINADVRSAFALGGSESGVLVIAVADGGVADTYGIEPGDMLSDIKGKKIKAPIDVDTYVYYWIGLGTYDLIFDYYRAGVIGSATTTITEVLYSEEIDFVSVESWESWSVEGFSYEEFYSEYSEVMIEEYSSSETTIEETVTSEEFTSEVSEESMEATEETSVEATDEGSSEVVTTEEGSDDEAIVLDQAEEEAVDGDESADDAGAEDESMGDSSADEGMDDSGADDSGADEGGDEGGGDEGGGDEGSE